MSLANPKPFASLSSALLARKGHARPAMRPQGLVSLTQPTSIVDDLGWNDMGEDVQPAPLPPVLAQREALAEELAAVDEAQAAPAAEPVDVHVVVADEPQVEPASPVVTEVAEGPAVMPTPRTRKAAFTLRLDADRHLRLRLASATRHRSAQLLVTEALDAFLSTMPDVEELARRLPRAGDLK